MAGVFGPQMPCWSGVDGPWARLQQIATELPDVPWHTCVPRLQQPQLAQSSSVLHGTPAPVVLVVEAPGVVVVLPNVVELPKSVVVGNAETAEPQHTGKPVSLHVRRQHVLRFRLQLRVARRRQAFCRFAGQSASRGSAAAQAATSSRQSVPHCLHAFEAAAALRDVVAGAADATTSANKSTLRMRRPYRRRARRDKSPIGRRSAPCPHRRATQDGSTGFSFPEAYGDAGAASDPPPRA
jgi:hypothetical protein